MYCHVITNAFDFRKDTHFLTHIWWYALAQMKRRRAVQLVALSGLSLPLAGCTDEAAQEDNETDDANETDDVDEEEPDSGSENAEAEDDAADEGEDETDELDEQEFSGSGSEAIEDVELEDGLTVVDATYEGEEEFEVRLILEDSLEDDDGESADDGEDDGTDEETRDTEDDGDADTDDETAEDDDLRTLFVNSTGEYTGQTAHDLEEGTYVLSVVADGDWEVTVLQPRDTSGDEPPISISGDGNEVHGPFEFDGTYEPSGEFDGERINVNVRAPTGESDDDTENDTFVFHEDSIDAPAEFAYEGVGYVAVKSDGEWSVELE